MANPPEQPLIVQSDHSLLLEVGHDRAESCREAILPFADLLKSPEHVHTYRVTPLSLWNASASGLEAVDVLERLESYSRYPLPPNLVLEIETQMGRYGLVELLPGNRDEIVVHVIDPVSAQEVFLDPTVRPFLLDDGNGDPLRRRVRERDIFFFGTAMGVSFLWGSIPRI